MCLSLLVCVVAAFLVISGGTELVVCCGEACGAEGVECLR